MKVILGGVSAPKGFKSSGIHCGIKHENKKDLALVCSETPTLAAGVFTKNIVKGHSLELTMKNLSSGNIKGIVINSGNANACLGKQGKKNALEIANCLSDLIGCNSENIVVGSTGIIGEPLKIECIKKGINKAFSNLSNKSGSDAAKAIMTTDLVPKEIAVEFKLNNKTVRIGAMAKGSGMIHPNMATMIGIITTDLKISKELLHCALTKSVNKSFNRISVDGDTSVCDMVVIAANGMSDNTEVITKNNNYLAFQNALDLVCRYLARLIAKDGEGATKLIEINVKGAKTKDDAYDIACTIAKSPLVKTAIYGEDANWGRIITAAGYSGVIFDPDKLDIYIGNLKVFGGGCAVQFNELEAKKILSTDEIFITLDLHQGNYVDRMWTCDFSHKYIDINADYRS